MKDINEIKIREVRLRELFEKHKVEGLKSIQIQELYKLCTANDGITDEKFLEFVERLRGNFYNENDLF
ncbi:MAG: hypothetical protein K0R07_39 [Sedimentibacter sp.]|jgi:hypothetical protein|nr:hypothetical protein [Sedimentibacter sp.]